MLFRSNQGPSHISVTKTEKRAPTDESVRLLREMEDAAKGQVLAAVRVENTPVDGVLHVMRDTLSDVTHFACVFKVNGKRMEARFEDKHRGSRQYIAIGIRDAIAEAIANELTANVLKACEALEFQPRIG